MLRVGTKNRLSAVWKLQRRTIRSKCRLPLTVYGADGGTRTHMSGGHSIFSLANDPDFALLTSGKHHFQNYQPVAKKHLKPWAHDSVPVWSK